MKKLTKKEVQEIVRSINLNGSVDKISNFEWDIEVSGYGGVSYDQLLKISELFDTQNINFRGYSYQGCPTCGPDNVTIIEIRK